MNIIRINLSIIIFIFNFQNLVVKLFINLLNDVSSRSILTI